MGIKIKKYVKKEQQLMFPWFPEFDMRGVSVSDEDKKNGSPKHGDMIAINPKNPSDKWLVAEKFFKENYIEAAQ